MISFNDDAKFGQVGIRLEDCFYIDIGGNAVYLTANVGGQALDPFHP